VTSLSRRTSSAPVPRRRRKRCTLTRAHVTQRGACTRSRPPPLRISPPLEPLDQRRHHGTPLDRATYARTPRGLLELGGRFRFRLISIARPTAPSHSSGTRSSCAASESCFSTRAAPVPEHPCEVPDVLADERAAIAGSKRRRPYLRSRRPTRGGSMRLAGSAVGFGPSETLRGIAHAGPVTGGGLASARGGRASRARCRAAARPPPLGG
jgi:hypothetical protein